MRKILIPLVCLALWLPGVGIAGEDFEVIDLGKPKQGNTTSKGQEIKKDESAFADCMDDPRLETDIFEIMQSDNPAVVPPITVTPETFLLMDGEVQAKLAGNMIICPKNPVLKNGKPLRKIAVEFPVLWTQIYKAAQLGDTERLKTLLTNFIAKPMEPKGVLRLDTVVDLDKDKKQLLYKTAGVNMGRYPMVIDFFVGLGGKSTEKAVVFLDDASEKFKNELEAAKKAGLPIFNHNTHTEGLISSEIIDKKNTIRAGLKGSDFDVYD